MTRIHTFGALLALTTTLAACASTGATGPTARPITPAAWETATAADTATRADLARWWEQLADPTLTTLIARAVDGSPDVRVAQARLQQARALQAQAAAALWPTVTASGSTTARRSGQRAVGLDGQTSIVNVNTGSYGASLDASWEPDIVGGIRKGRDAATADLQAVAADLAGAHVSLAADVATTYLELRTLQARLDVAGRNVASQAETLELTGFRAQAGLVTELDVEQARANLEQTRAAIPTLEASARQAMYRLATLAGAEPGAFVAELTAVMALPAVPESLAFGIPAETLRQRPDVQAAERRLAAETARLAQTDARRLPSFALSGSVGAEVLKGAGSAGTSVATSILGSLFQTVFDRGRIRQQIAAQGAVQAQAVATYEGTVLTALEDVERALVAFERSRDRLNALEAAATAADTAATLARTQYAAGLIDFQTVLSTERTVLSVQESVVVTTGDRMAALVQLYRALGGGWSPATTTETTTS